MKIAVPGKSAPRSENEKVSALITINYNLFILITCKHRLPKKKRYD